MSEILDSNIENEINLFKNPTSEYRGATLWEWNCKVTKGKITEQIDLFKKMGFGGFFIHSSIGQEDEFMGKDFIDLVSYANEYARKNDMFCYLCDEDRYPSGSAGGIVTKDYHFRRRSLILSPHKDPAFSLNREKYYREIKRGKKTEGYYVAAYRVMLDSNSCLSAYKKVSMNYYSEKWKIWYAYMKVSDNKAWFNNNAYVDVLNKKSIKKFIDVSYEKYFEKVGRSFNKSIPAISTMSPRVYGVGKLRIPDEDKETKLSYSDDMDASFMEKYGISLLEILPELIWELPKGKKSIYRCYYREHLSDTFSKCFSKQIADWCEEHKINFTGYLRGGESLLSQTMFVSEMMRVFKDFQWPGIEIKRDRKYFISAKQAVSVARQYGKEKVLSNMYGCNHWSFDFKGLKLQGDWLAALGVSLRRPVSSFMSMLGNAKREFPGSINYQSPWYSKYSYLEDYFARINTVLTKGEPIVNVAIIHPIESYWSVFGSDEQTKAIREQLDENFRKITDWLVYGNVDFDYISESMFPEQCNIEDITDLLPVGRMKYNTIIVPDVLTLRSSTMDRLEKYVKMGGKLIFAGEIPQLVDLRPSVRIKRLSKVSVKLEYEKSFILKELKGSSEVEILNYKFVNPETLISQIRKDGENRWLFICHVNRVNSRFERNELYHIYIKGEWKVTVYNALTGEIEQIRARYEDGRTRLFVSIYAEDSLLFKLEPGRGPESSQVYSTIKDEIKYYKELPLSQPNFVEFEEKNVFLIDYARVSIDMGPWSSVIDILSADDMLRQQLGYPRWKLRFTQPWSESDDDTHTVSVKMSFFSEVFVEDVQLALERPEISRIELDGRNISNKVIGYFTDKSIKTIMLGKIDPGEHELTLTMPFSKKIGIEWCYLLGDFGVNVIGSHSVITEKNKKILFGDLCTQGYPFYSGNVTYHMKAELYKSCKSVKVYVPHFFANVCSVSVNGKDAGVLAFSPHILELGDMRAGEYDIAITAYGNRYNSFGSLHNANDDYRTYSGPEMYRTSGSEWSDAYVLNRNGIMSAIKLLYLE